MDRSSSLHRLIFTACAVVLVGACASDSNVVPNRFAQISFQPVLPSELGAEAFGLVLDNVRIQLTRPPGEIVIDTIVAFDVDSDEVQINLRIPLEEQTETFDLLLELRSGSTVLFSGTQPVTINEGPNPTPDIPVTFQGPGNNVAALFITPADTIVTQGDVVQFDVTAEDAQGAPVTQFFVVWRSSDETVATVNAAGAVTAPNVRDQVLISANAPNGVAVETSLSFVPAPGSIALLSPPNPAAIVNTQLPFDVQVLGSDGIGVPNVSVQFAAASTGSVADPTVVTDALGNASTTILLGTDAGPRTFTASVMGLSTLSYGVTALADVPAAVLSVSGDAQTGLPGILLPQPLVVQVTDQFSNPVPGIQVDWTVTSGGGTVVPVMSTSDASGLAQTAWTLGALGPGTVEASVVAVVQPPVVFNATASIIFGTKQWVGGDGTGPTTWSIPGNWAPTGVPAVTDIVFVPVTTDQPVLTASASIGGLRVDAGATVDVGTFILAVAGDVEAGNTIVGTGTVMSTGTNVTLSGTFPNLTVTGTATAPAPLTVNGELLVSGAGASLVTNDVLTTAGNAIVRGDGTAFAFLTIGPSSDIGLALVIDQAGNADLTGSLQVGDSVLVGSGNSELQPAGNQLSIAGLLITRGGGRLFMQSPSAVINLGSDLLIFGFNPAGSLTDGDLRIAGDLNIVNAGSFVPTGNHRVTLTGGEAQTLTMNGAAFNDLEIAQSTFPILLPADVTVNRQLIVPTLVTPLVQGTVAATLNVGDVDVDGVTFDNASLAITDGALTLLDNVTFQNMNTGVTQLSVSHPGATTPFAFNNLVFSTVPTTGLYVSAIDNLADGNLLTLNLINAIPAGGNVFTSVTGGAVVNWPISFPGSQWLGVNTNWSDPSNWSTGQVPQSSDDVLVPTAAPSQPVLTANSFTNDLTVEAGATLNTNGFILTAAGNVDGGSTITGTGTVLMAGLGVTVTGSFPNVTIAGTVTAAGPVTVTGDLTVDGGDLDVDAQTISVSGNFATQAGGTLTMQAAGLLDVAGDVTFAGGQTGGLLTAGTIQIAGNYTATTIASMSASGTHFVVFDGAVQQLIDGEILSPFNDLHSQNPAGIQFVGSMRVNGDIVLQSGAGPATGAANINLGGSIIDVDDTGRWQVATTTFEASPTILPSLIQTTAIFSATSHTMTAGLTVDGDLRVSGVGGSLNLGGQTVVVTGNFAVSAFSILTMQNPADVLDVAGNVAFGGNSVSGLVTAGTIFVGADFNQGGDPESFHAGGTNTVTFNGSAPQSLTFASPGIGVAVAASHFANVAFNGTGAVTLGSDAFAHSNLISAPAAATILGSGNRLAVGGLDVDNLVLDNVLFEWNGTAGFPSFGSFVGFDNVTFQNNATTATQFTVVHPGAATPFTFNNLVFSPVPTTGFYVSATDNVADTDVLTLDLTNATPADGNAFTQRVGGAVVNWPVPLPVGQWTGATSTDWQTGSNWSNGLVPTSADDVLVPAAPANQPVLSANANARDLTVEPGATLDMAAFVMTVAGNLDAGATITGAGIVSMTGTGVTLQGTLSNITISGTVTAAGPTTMTGNLTVAGIGADLNVGGQTINVTGNSDVTSNATLTMQSPSDVLDVLGNVRFGGENSAGLFTAGVINVGGDFTQATAVSGAAFQASSSHRTVLNGAGPQTVLFSSPGSGPSSSRFGELEIANTGTGVTFTTDAEVSGNLTMTSGATVVVGVNLTVIGDLNGASPITGAGTVSKFGPGSNIFGSVPDLVVGDTVTLSGNLTVTGNLTIQDGPNASGNVLTLNGFTATVSGNAVVGVSGFGGVRMDQASDVLDVAGDLSFAGGNTGTRLTAGTIRLAGSFTQPGPAPDGYDPSGTHLTVLDGAGAQTITMTNPTVSTFNDLDLANTGPGVTLASNIVVDGTLSSAGGVVPTVSGAATTVTTSGLAIDGVVFDNAPLIVNDGPVTLFDNVTFQNMVAAVTQLTINHPGAVTPFTFNNTSFLTIPTSGFYISANDNLDDGNIFTIEMAGSNPADGSLFEQELGGTDVAVINWPGAFPGATWNGSASTDWNTATNWGTSVVPTLTDDVLIPVAPVNQPVLSANAFANSLTVEPGATVNTNGFILQAAGNVDAGTSITGAGILRMTGAGVTVRGTVPTLQPNGTVTGLDVTISNTLTVAGQFNLTQPTSVGADLFVLSGGLFQLDGQAVTVGGNALVDGGSSNLDLAGGQLDVTGNFTVQASGRLTMTNALDVLVIGGNGTFAGQNDATLTAGTIQLAGSFAQTSNLSGFQASGTHRVVFNGTTQQSINMVSPFAPNSHFQEVDVSNPAGVAIASSNVLVLGDFTVTGGPVADLGANGLTVQGALSTPSDVTLTSLSVGSLSVAGTYLVTNTTITGTGQVIPAALPYVNLTAAGAGATYAGTSVTGILAVNGAGASLNVAGAITVGTDLSVTGAGASMVLGGAATVPGSILLTNGSLTLGGASSSAGVQAFGGGADLILNGNQLNVANDFAVTGSGRFTMTNALDILVIGGNGTFSGANAGTLTAGEIQLSGNFTQAADLSGFPASGTHRTVFVGLGPQTISMASPFAVNSHFQELEIDQSSTVTLLTDVLALGPLFVPAIETPVVIGGGNTLTVSGLSVDAVTFDNAQLVSNDGTITQFDNVTFQNMDAAATQLAINHPGAVSPFTFNNLAFLTAPTAGSYISAIDNNALDGTVLTIDLIGSNPADGSANTATAGGAVVNWPGVGPVSWTSGVSGNWSDGANWGTGLVPGPANDVTITGAGTFTVTMDVDPTVASLTIGNGTGTQTVNANGRTITASGNVTVELGAELNLVGSTLDAARLIENGGFTVVLDNSTVNAPFDQFGSLVVRGTSAITGLLSTTAGGSITVEGTAASDAMLTVASGFTNDSDIQLTNTSAGANASLVVTTGTLTNSLFGSITSATGAGGGLRTLTADLDNQGTVTVSHPLTVDAAAATYLNPGTITVAAGGDLTVTGADAFANTGTLDVASGPADFTFSGTGAGFTTSGTLTIGTGQTLLVTNGPFAFTAGTIGGAGGLGLFDLTATLTPTLVTGPLGVSIFNTTLNGPGTITNTVGGGFTIANSIVNTDIDNQGTFDSDGTSAINGALTTNATSNMVVIGSATWGNSILTVANGFINNGAINLQNEDVNPLTAELIVTTGTLVNAAGAQINSLFDAGGGARLLTADVENRATISVTHPLTVAGLFTVPTAAAATVSGDGNTLTINDVNIDGLTMDNVPLVTNGLFTDFRNVTFQSMDPAATHLTVNHPGGDVPFDFSAFTFLTAPAGGLYVSANDDLADGRPLIIDLNGSNPVDGSAFTAVSGGAVVNWGAAIPVRWANAVSGNWNVGANWTGGLVPGPTDIVEMILNGTYTVTLDVDPTVASLTVGGTSGSQRLNVTARTLTVTGDVNVQGTGTLSINTGSTLNATNVINTSAASLELEGGGTINAAVDNRGMLTSQGGTLTGTVTTTAASVIRSLSGSIVVDNGFTNNGLIELTNLGPGLTSGILVGQFSTLTNGSTGTINALAGFGGGARALSCGIDNQGTVNIEVDVIWGNCSQASYANSGTINVTGGLLDILLGGGNFDNTGSIDVTGGDLLVRIFSLSDTEVFTTSGAVTIGAGRTLTVTDPVSPGATFEYTGGTLGGGGSATFSLVNVILDQPLSSASLSLSFSDASLSGTGAVTNAAGQTMTLTNTAVSSALNNAGVLIAGGTSSLDGAFTNAAGSTMLVQGTPTVNALLTVANGFVNDGGIEITNNAPGSSADLVVTTGTLVNMASGSITSRTGSGGGSRSLTGMLDHRGKMTLEVPLTVGGQLIVPGASAATVDGAGGTLTVQGVDVNGLTLDKTPLVTTDGVIKRFDNVTFQNMDLLATQFTVNHPGAATPFTFDNVAFLDLPDGGFLVRANDNDQLDGNTLTLDFVGSTPTDGSADTDLANGAEVTWAAASVNTWVNAAGGPWSTPGNWSQGTVPDPSDDVLIDLDGTYTVVLDIPATVLDLTVGSAVGTQTLSLAGLTLTVSGDFATVNGGALSMTGSTDALAVQGNASFAGVSTDGLLTDGLFTLAGNFSQSGVATSYAPSGLHLTRLNGAGVPQQLSFTSITTQVVTASHFAEWEITNPAGVNLLSDVTVTGSVVNTSGGPINGLAATLGVLRDVTSTGDLNLNGLFLGGALSASGGFIVGTTGFFGTGVTIPAGLPYTNVEVDGSPAGGTLVTLGGDVSVNGGFEIFGLNAAQFVMNGNRLDVAGNFEANGLGFLTMTFPGDILTVGGTALFDGASTDGQLTDGVVMLAGGFFQTNAPNSYRTSGSHKTVLNGNLSQTVSFLNPGATGLTSQFNALDIDKTSGSLTLNSDVVITGSLAQLGSPVTVLSGVQSISAGSADIDGLTFDNTMLTIDGGAITQFDNVTFQNMDPAATQLTVNHAGAATPFTLNNAAFLTTPTTGLYVSANDNVGDANTLTLDFVLSTPSDGSAFTATTGGAVVNWSAAPVNSWINAAGGNWSNSANWSQGSVPDAFDEVFIDPDGTYTVTVDVPASASMLTVGAGVGTQTLAFAGQTLIVSGDFSTLSGGRVAMGLLSDVLVIRGDASFGGASTDGLITGGVVRVVGDFTQAGLASSYATGGDHQTSFVGSGQQLVSFANPGTGGGTSQFTNLRLGKPAGSVSLGSAVFVEGTFNHLAPITLFASPVQALSVLSVEVDGLTFDNVTLTLTAAQDTEGFFRNVTFQNMDPAATQLTINHPGIPGDEADLDNFAFLTTPTTGLYLSANDTDPVDGNVLDIYFTNTTPLDGTAFTATSNGAIVSWNPTLADAIVVTPAQDTLLVAGQTVQLTAQAFEGGNPLGGVTFTWRSSNPFDATVDQTGLVTAVSAGQATITARARGGAEGAAVIIANIVEPVSAFSGAYNGGDGIVGYGGLLGDEFGHSGTFVNRREMDQRGVVDDNILLGRTFGNLQNARRSAEITAGLLQTGSPTDPEIGRMLTLAGYTYIAMAENFCSGVPIDDPDVGETTAALFALAQTRFSEALAGPVAADVGDAARVGRARAALGLGDFTGAGTDAATIATGFVFNTTHGTPLPDNGVFTLNLSQNRLTLADAEGTNGLPFRTAGDPRVTWVADGLGFNDATPQFDLLKYPAANSPMPLATGHEARLIEAEAFLSAGNIASFIAAINTVRADFALAPVVDPGAGAARVDLLFSERAFTLAATGHRLGDLRRLIATYGRAANTIFPTGAYPIGGSYGTDANLPVPTGARGPSFTGCTDRGS